MRRYMLLIMSMLGIFILGACKAESAEHTKPLPENMMGREGQHQPGMMMKNENNRHQGRMMGHGHSELALQDSSGENKLNLPPVLEKDKEVGNDVYYTIEAQEGYTEIFDGVETKTLGYNGSFLGPVLMLKKGQTAHLTLKNSLHEETTFHWHGLVISGEGDGGPHEVIQAGEEKEITFKVQQDRATLWFHPHPLGKTGEQVYKGLAGLLYIEDERDESYEYGENDFPLIIQDKLFDEEKQLNYEAARNPDGTIGDTLLINGTVNPKLTVNQEKVRFRLLNGANARNITVSLSNGQSFTQIASDGGLLNEPIELKEIQLTPSERAEIVVDFSNIKKDIQLMTDDGTVLLPFEISDNKVDVVETEETEETDTVHISEKEMKQEVTKEFVLFGMMNHVTINGKQFDPSRIDFTQKVGETEVWEIYNKPDMIGGMIHPFHVHGTQFKIISINDQAPPKNLQGYKDTISLEPGDRAKIAVKFEEKGVYMYHCHILEHEDNGMMGQIKVE